MALHFFLRISKRIRPIWTSNMTHHRNPCSHRISGSESQQWQLSTFVTHLHKRDMYTHVYCIFHLTYLPISFFAIHGLSKPDFTRSPLPALFLCTVIMHDPFNSLSANFCASVIDSSLLDQIRDCWRKRRSLIMKFSHPWLFVSLLGLTRTCFVCWQLFSLVKT